MERLGKYSKVRDPYNNISITQKNYRKMLPFKGRIQFGFHINSICYFKILVGLIMGFTHEVYQIMDFTHKLFNL